MTASESLGSVKDVTLNEEVGREQLAELVDLNIRTVQKIEAGNINILLTTLLRIQRALKCHWNKLVGD
jgi:transcriptional regulator with XRE-family HTH domain